MIIWDTVEHKLMIKIDHTNDNFGKLIPTIAPGN